MLRNAQARSWADRASGTAVVQADGRGAGLLLGWCLALALVVAAGVAVPVLTGA